MQLPTHCDAAKDSYKERAAIVPPIPSTPRRPLTRSRGGAKLLVVIDIKSRGIPEAQGRSANRSCRFANHACCPSGFRSAPLPRRPAESRVHHL